MELAYIRNDLRVNPSKYLLIKLWKMKAVEGYMDHDFSLLLLDMT